MQIHELTKHRQQTDEGILDGIKAAVSAAKTGYNAGKAADKSTGAALAQGAKNFGRGITSNAMMAQATTDAQKQAAMAKYDALKKKYGWKDADDDKAAAAATAGPDISKAAQDLTATFQQTDLFKDIVNPSGATAQANQGLNDTTAPVVSPGNRLVMPKTTTGYGSDFYLDSNGAWTNGLNQRVTDQTTIAKLNSLANGGAPGVKEEPAPQAAQQAKGKPATAQKQPAQPAGTSPMAEAAPVATAQPAAADPSIVQKIEQDPKLKPMFDQFGKEFGVTPDEVKARPEVKQALASLLKVINSKAPAGKNQRVAKAFQSYATVVLTAMKAEGTGEDTNGDGVPDNQSADQQTSTNPVIQQSAEQSLLQTGQVDKASLDKVKKVAQNPMTKPKVKQALGLAESSKPLVQRLEEAICMLNEAQVRITKDIVVPTNAGNYVKKASDQQWYAPNGVMIDSEKYADYIKKLDATPQAQTRYQADQISGSGSDEAFKKSQTPPPPPPPPPQAPAAAAPAPQPDPMDQALQRQKMQQWLRGQNVDSLNAQIKDTTNQLRNAQIFGTGQETYLQQQLAQLIAMKV